MYIPIRRYWNLLSTYLAAQRGRVLLLALLLLSMTGLELLNPQILRYFIDRVQGGAATGALVAAAGLFIGIALLQQTIAVGATYVGEQVAWRATNSLRFDLARHALNLDLQFHNARTPGELIERVDEDVTALANFFSQFVIILLGNLLLLLGTLLLLFWEQWSIGLLATVFALLAGAILNETRRRTTHLWVKGRQASADFAGFVEERLAGLEDIRSSGATDYKMRLLYGHFRNLYRRYRDARVIGSIGPISTAGLHALALAGTLALGAYWFSRGTMTIGAIFLVSYYVRQLERPLRQIMRQIEDLQRAGASIERVDELIHTGAVVQDGPGAALPDGPLAVAFDDVSFAYYPEHPVLHGVSFRLRPGAVLGVLGRTGSGKTTLTRLLFRLYDPTSGVVRLGDTDIRQPTLAQLRGRVGMVTQDVQLFRGPIRENLTFFDEHVPDAAIMEAIKGLGLQAWFRSLPGGLDTLVGSGGSSLSAGEAQLLAFTRIFLKD
ncbi:MAG TPA: ABC transporter ATP-binding protein, partial [Herpetosiphonaceae bacterium]|nr:ABC transporter ATP-binding protein [Herpetosiphonaceae bacterium]